ncbi:hypothetical protein CCYA_CCYA10G2783 [Cyanidiococcus yangmingshanensis]|nr:hypothetical protein CCYA_CCYA10G2783 [Cyanidiococcus yangmingshanensis]
MGSLWRLLIQRTPLGLSSPSLTQVGFKVSSPGTLLRHSWTRFSAVRSSCWLPTRPFRSSRVLQQPPGPRIAFDTLKLVRAFEASEFTPKQAEALSSALSQIIAEALAYNTEVVATKAEFSALKSEMQILEKADFAVLRSDLQLVEKKVETFMAQIYTELERIENRVIKWVIGAAGTAVMLILGIMRALGGGTGGPSNHGAGLSAESAVTEHSAGPKTDWPVFISSLQSQFRAVSTSLVMERATKHLPSPQRRTSALPDQDRTQMTPSHG